MGYNNNNAGMHFLNYRHYGSYDNLRYYDELVAQENDRKRELREEAKKKALEEASMRESAKKAQNTQKKKNEQKELKTNISTDQTETIPWYWKREIGTEEIIDRSHFRLMDLVSKNIMIYALRNKKDILKILVESEQLLKRDSRINGHYTSYAIPMMEKSMVLLSIVAEKMGCSIHEFFIDDEGYRKKFIYDLIDDIDDYWENERKFNERLGCHWPPTSDICDIDDEGNVTITIRNFDLEYDCVNFNDDLGSRHSFIGTMDLTLEKGLDWKGDTYYSLWYGFNYLNYDTGYDVLPKGAYLYDEEKGKLQEFVDRLLEEHPEWKEIE